MIRGRGDFPCYLLHAAEVYEESFCDSRHAFALFLMDRKRANTTFERTAQPLRLGSRELNVCVLAEFSLSLLGGDSCELSRSQDIAARCEVSSSLKPFLGG